MGDRELGQGLGMHPYRLRYAAPTGTVLNRWEGARQPTVWTVPPPEVDPRDARSELARRYLHVFGPATPSAFAKWAGIGRPQAREVFDALAARSLTLRVAAHRGPRAFGRAPCSSPVSSSGPGGALRRTLTIQPRRRLSRAERDAVESEAESLPLAGVEGRIVVSWDD
jgi:hypothetical protein